MARTSVSISPSKATKHAKTVEHVATMAVRNVPESLRLAVRSKAAKEGLTLQQKVIELMSNYAKHR